VEVSHSASRLRDPDDGQKPLGNRDDVLVIYSHDRRALRDAVGVASRDECLRQVAISEPLPIALAIVDSAIRRTPIDRIDLEIVRAALPRHAKAALELATGLPESGTESVLLAVLHQEGLSPRPQSPIPLTDFDRVDILIGDRLAIECDSEAHHGGSNQRLRDLRRDADLAALGFIVLRFDYRQVFFELDSVLAAVRTYVHLGLHRASVRLT
jgi:very-short-patch-repair endonuclease